MPSPKVSLILTCEHGGAEILSDFQRLFTGRSALEALKSHRAMDFGALLLARDISKRFQIPLFSNSYTRLLIDCNRSRHHKSLYSEFSTGISASEKEILLNRIYTPYRDRIEAELESRLQKGDAVIHLSVHSFTPVFQNQERNLDLGILYDPSRGPEKDFAKTLKKTVLAQIPKFRIRMNFPYRGISDGFTTHLRKKWPAHRYLGVELEWNQQLFQIPDLESEKWKNKVFKALESLISFGFEGFFR